MAVDDESIYRSLMEKMLTKENYQVILLEDGNDVLKVAREKMPQVILLDIKMPKKNGFEVCQELKSDELTQSIPVIFISGIDDQENIIKGLDMGAVDYITKPFDVPEVLARIHTQLRLSFFTQDLIKNEQKKTLSASIVSQNHMFNQSLTTIIGQAEVLKLLLNDGNIDKDQALKSLNRIDEATWEIADIIKKLQNVDEVAYTEYLDKTEMLDLDKDEKVD